LDFGLGDVGSELAQTVTVTNIGDADLTLLGLILDPIEGGFTVSELGSDQLPAGTETTFAVTWEVTEFGPVSGSVWVESDDLNDPSVQVDFVGDTTTPDLVIEPASHDFGALDYGVQDSVTVTITNQGQAPATLTDWSYVSSSAEELDWVSVDSTASVTLLPGESTSVIVNYAPADEVADEGTLLITTDAPETPQLSASQSGTGVAPLIYEYDIEVLLTADDEWLGWIDGTKITASNQTAWSYSDTLNWTLESGTHVLAIHAKDVGRYISGFNAVIWVDGVSTWKTGDGVWKMIDVMPASDFIYDTFDDSAWSTAIVCSDPSIWGTYWPADFIAAGSEWVWWTSDCGNLQEAWFRLSLDLP
jgi:hypothetical protein